MDDRNQDQTVPLPPHLADKGQQIIDFISTIKRSEKELKAGALTAEQHARNVEQVKAATQELATQEPGSFVIQACASRTMLAAGDIEAAKSYAEKAVELNPDDAFSLNTAALAYYAEGNYPKASELSRQALEANPGYKPAIAVYKLSNGRASNSGSGIQGEVDGGGA